jgi:YD repeat-containing protein
MKKILSLFAITLVIASCSKDKTSSPATPTEKKLREFINVSAPSDNRTYTYDGDRLMKITRQSNYALFEYLPSKLVVKEYDANTNNLIGTSESELDASGKTITKKRIGANGTLQYTMYFTYDAAGYLINAKTENVSGSISESKYGISGGNAVSEEYYVNGILDDKTEYVYDASTVSKMNFVMETNYEMENLAGVPYKNELVGYKRYNAGGQLEGHVVHTYQYDADGYPKEKTSTNQLTGVTYKYQFIYQ